MRTQRALRAGTGLGLLLMLFAQVLALPTSAQAHGDTIKVVVTGQRDGHVTTEITWENDGDAVDESVAATVNATSPDGSRSMGPWVLVRDPGSRKAWRTAETLAPGTWKVTVDVGFPALGKAAAEVSVPVVDPSPPTTHNPPTASAPAPTTAPTATTTPTPAAAPATPSPSASPKADGASSAVGWSLAGLAGFALVGAAAGVLVRRTRARRR
ncbi:hypothetical protein RGF97_04910 [Streptomyces roseicoloratus]|uniref:CopC domain-containing protein n=1 Tax=Streptomyces roseicoloratus TaxID=2508722 RepID=A0ABY9RTQ7_9ACTN|nr:hypothetical protein [Streptomyces roseicoloratus]WMX44325.1 hypothetical protein RGF97_04910 [Streptomyces roseicoloratus]